MKLKKTQKIYPIIAFALCASVVGCSSGSDTNSTSSESSAPSNKSNSMIDEKLKATVECVVTKVDSDDISNIEDVSDSEVLLTLKADSYFYYDQIVTVTNYSNDAQDVYLEHRLVDANGKVFDTSNFLETVNAGETLTLTDNQAKQAATDIVFRGDASKKKTWFNCPVVKSHL